MWVRPLAEGVGSWNFQDLKTSWVLQNHKVSAPNSFCKWSNSHPVFQKMSHDGRSKKNVLKLSSSSWLLRVMDPCRLLLDFKNRLFAPSKKNYHVQKRTIPSKISALRAFKKKLSASKKTSALRAKAFNKKFKKNSSRFAADFVQKKTPKYFFFERICSKKTLHGILWMNLRVIFRCFYEK